MMVGVGPTLVSMVERGPLGLGPVCPTKRIIGMMGVEVTSPLLTIPSWKRLGGAPTMGIDGEVNKVGSY